MCRVHFSDWVVRSAILLTISARGLSAQIPARGVTAGNLAGTTWQLVRFEGGDDRILTPGVRSNYTLEFGSDGRVSARIDCNRGSATWSSPGPNQLAFGPLAVTRAACPAGSLFDQIVRQWPYIRSYVIRNGHLFLSLMADAGIYEYEPMNSAPVGHLSRAIAGTATYRERIALPANAVFEATMEDISRADAASVLIARIRNEEPGNPPIPFTIAYDPNRIAANHQYAVRARILVDNRLWFATDQVYPVLTFNSPTDVQLLLVRTSVQSLPGRVQSAVALENTYWKLVYVGNTAVYPSPQHPEANLVLNPQNRTVSGSGGCNRFTGSYSLNGDRISFSRVAMTMMACISGMETEDGFRNAINSAARWRISGQNLELLDARGNSLARFEAGNQR